VLPGDSQDSLAGFVGAGAPVGWLPESGKASYPLVRRVSDPDLSTSWDWPMVMVMAVPQGSAFN
jgi:hypothetical protein